MKKLIAANILFFSFFVPAHVFADATYTCSGGSGTLAPITVNDPANADAGQVSAYISNCSNSGGTASGPSAQQLQTSPNDRVSQGFSAVGTANNADRSTFCTGGSCTYVPLEPLPGLPKSYGPNNGQGSFANLIGNSFKLLIGAGALIAIIMIVLGALTYMFSDIVGNKKKALDRIRGAMWAIVLLVSSYLILFTINPDLVQFKLNLSATNNFNITPNIPGTTNPAQMTPAERQAALDQCTQGGKTMHPRSDGTYSCQ